MSMHLYGAGHLMGPDPAWRREVGEFWQALAGLHEVKLHLGEPGPEYLREDFAKLWSDPNWLGFSLGPSPNRVGTTDAFLLQAHRTGNRILEEQPQLRPRVIWTKVPAFRFLYFMFWHERLAEGVLVMEHTSGDAAELHDARHVLLVEAVENLWINYCWDMSSEEPVVYWFELQNIVGGRG